MRAPVILAALAVLLSHAAGAAETPPIVYRHASLIDGTGGPLRAGMAVVNVNPLYRPRELEHQLNDSGAETIVVLENFASRLIVSGEKL